jgi:hypothetical protein
MTETKYGLKDEYGMIARYMTLETATMLAAAYMEKYWKEPNLTITLFRENLDIQNNEETE